MSLFFSCAFSLEYNSYCSIASTLLNEMCLQLFKIISVTFHVSEKQHNTQTCDEPVTGARSEGKMRFICCVEPVKLHKSLKRSLKIIM